MNNQEIMITEFLKHHGITIAKALLIGNKQVLVVDITSYSFDLLFKSIVKDYGPSNSSVWLSYEKRMSFIWKIPEGVIELRQQTYPKPGYVTGRCALLILHNRTHGSYSPRIVGMPVSIEIPKIEIYATELTYVVPPSIARIN